ncbi:MAG: STAS domain-containing protein [Cylindrospermopsis raciborskii 1523720]|uniref:STAS domain-containing protein n=1 Tax=Cylindrospermopsis raciborskii TaxID=77022 RepID=UPI002B483BC4|nr:STAS domain-containing protein [Cylindrospermopsis raciborskii]MEB3145352.1 STAS domain-containing protein [Cylindrospermopsis raciborskii]
MSKQVQTLTLTKNLNSESALEFQENIAKIVESKAEVVLIDCQNITFLDSRGLGYLVLAFKNLQKAGIKMVLCSLSEQVRMIFELTSIDEIFEIFATQDDFHRELVNKT